MSRPRVGLLLFGWSLLASPRAIAGEPGARAFSLEYAAPNDCPGRSDFEAELRRRVPDARIVSAPEAGLAFRVVLSRAQTAYVGTLWIALADQPETRRDVADVSCWEAAASLSVIAALLLDRSEPETAPEHAEAVSSPAETADFATASSTAAAPAVPAVPAVPAAPAAPADTALKASAPTATRGRTVDRGPVRRQPEPADRAGARPALFALATWESAVAPAAPVGVYGGGELSWLGPGAWSPSALLGLLYTTTSVATVPQGSAAFRLVAGRFVGCPWRFGGRALGVRPCVELDAGGLRGSGRIPAQPETHWMPWLAGGVALRGELELSSILTLEVLGSASLLARNDLFIFRPRVSVYDVPALSVGGGAGLRARIP
jgi:hypothetical protein